MDVGVSLVSFGICQDGFIGVTNSCFILDIDLDTTSIRFMQDIRGNNLYYERETDFLANGDCFSFSFCQFSKGYR